MTVTPEFAEASTRAAIRALRRLEQTAIMLEKWAPEIFPETNEVNGVVQKHFGRVMMESAADAIREAWKGAIVEVTHFPDNPANLIEQRGKLRDALFEIAVLLRDAHAIGDSYGFLREAHDIAKNTLASNLVEGLPYSEEECPGHVASKDDAKVCGRCGVHIDSLRPEDA